MSPDAVSPEAANPGVSVLIVTYDSEPDLADCLAAVAEQSHRPLDLVIVDCRSRDRSVEVARTVETPGIEKTVHPLGENLGFSGGMNAALELTSTPYVLALNADARPSPDFVERLVDRAELRPRAAAVTGRLIRPPQTADDRPRLDACGMYLTRTWRHLDRGSGSLDKGQFQDPEQVFGGTGAATLYRRTALDDVAMTDANGRPEIFDELFFAYREDAELCFRFHERGWEVIYEPSAVAEHRRRVVPQGRSALPAVINYHSLKNRYLLRAYHQTPSNALRTLVPTLWRDLLAFGWVVLRERTSFGAYGWLWQNRREILRRRRILQNRRTAGEDAVDRWFRNRSLPLESGTQSP